ncbi:S-layer homology domain-containing protein, partial [Flavonifractor plautii]
VSMLVSLGIIEGKPDGSYAPTENVDRAQMAKMLSVIMNKGVDNSALYQSVNSGLTDITSNWAKGHINYCYTTGIIAGRGNGTFDPSATVTALEAAKMLLVAVGY